MSEDKTQNKRGLGRGLSALFEDEEGVYPQVEDFDGDESVYQVEIPIEHLKPGAYQPRQTFDDENIDQLASSIAEHGILQPLLIRPLDDSGQNYEIIAGERRWRAAQKAKLHTVPVIVAQIDDNAALQIALVENLQREDLNSLEEAQGYKRLIDEFGHTQEKLGQIIGKSRSHITNTLRLLNLPEEVQGYLNEGLLSAGHARALLTAEDPEGLAKAIIEDGISVRETERRAKGENTAVTQTEDKASSKTAEKQKKSADTLALESELSDALGLEVSIDIKSGQAGSLKVKFKDFDQLDEVVHRLSTN